jgi:hypothetical protein
VEFVRIDVSKEQIPTIRVTRIGELGTTYATTRNRSTLPHGITSKKKVFVIVTAVKTSNLTRTETVEIHSWIGLGLLYASRSKTKCKDEMEAL